MEVLCTKLNGKTLIYCNYYLIALGVYCCHILDADVDYSFCDHHDHYFYHMVYDRVSMVMAFLLLVEPELYLVLL